MHIPGFHGPLLTRPSGEDIFSPRTEEENRILRQSVQDEGGTFETRAGEMTYVNDPRYPGGKGFWAPTREQVVTIEDVGRRAGGGVTESPTTNAVRQGNTEVARRTPASQVSGDQAVSGPVVPRIDFPDIETGGLTGTVSGLVLAVVAVLAGIYVIGQAAKGAGEGAIR